MNQLTEFLVNSILEEDKNEIIGIYGGGFKPPIKGHLEVLQGALDKYPEMDKVIVSVGSGVRDEIDQEESLLIWDIYQRNLPVKVEIGASKTQPIRDIYNLAKDNPDKTIYWIIGAREGREDDLQDIEARTKSINKYGNIEVKVIQTKDPKVSGTNARKALIVGNKEKFFTYLPDNLTDEEKEEIFSIVRPAVKEQLNEHSMGSSIDVLPKLAELTLHMIDKGYNIEPLPGLEIIDDDVTNAEDFFGKTAYYDPNTQTIVLYTHGRHPKDIARSYAHEMIHHIQNLEGRLGDITTTNTQEDDYLNDIEAEANLKGTMTFRNWTDSLNEIGDASAAKLEWNPAQIEKIAKEIERKIAKQEDDTVEYYDTLPVINVISPESRTRYRVTVDASVDKPEDELAMTTLRVDFTTEEGGDDAINKGEQYKILATLTDIIIQLITRVNEIDSTTLDLVKFYAKDDTEGKYANPDSKRGKLYQAFINKNLSKLPGDWKMSTSDEVIMLSPIVNESGQKIAKKNMDDYKKSNNPSGKVSDPFGLNAYAYELAKGLEEAILFEGRYDKFVNQLSRIAFETIKDGFESGRKVLDVTFTVRPEEDEPDIESDMFEFDFRVVADYTEDKYKVDGGANEGVDDDGNDITPLLIVNFGIPKKPKWSTVSMDLKDVVRHELEHLTQSGDNVVGVVRDPKRPELNRPGKQMADDKFIRDMIDADLLPKADYFKLEKEIDAMMQGLYFKAKKSKRPFKDVIDDYLNTQPISKEEKEVILNLWRSRRKALSLPVFENEEKVMKEGMEDLYTIYLDMDGVIVDFDRQFEEAFGMPPREFEEGFGTEMFWKKIEERGVGFWRGMKWMPGGQELYNRVAQHNHYLLSSPSKSNTSKIGKHMWKKDNTPNTKLILSRSYNKKNYADKSNILIDDRESNIQQWRDAGGIGILYKSAEQVNAELDKLGL
jgi:PAS domain-containing protein